MNAENEKLWYEYSEPDRIKEVYGKFTIQDFWDWWTGGSYKVMEVRIKDFPLIKKIATDLNLFWSASGVYVDSAVMLKEVIKRTRDVTVWFGVNSRKKNWDAYGHKSFGGRDTNVMQIDVLFIDIDRMVKDGPAKSEQLANCDKLANKILERLVVQGWNKNYLKICSGNGVQLIIKLDFPIKLPEQEFDGHTNTFNFSEEFDKLRALVSQGIGKDILFFCRKWKDELMVEVDKACFNFGRVAALPFTRNYKFGGFTWRGIIEMHTEVNNGFSDYILSKHNNIQKYKMQNVFKKTKVLLIRDRILPGTLQENIVVKFMLENDLPAGMRNNYLWFQIKCLLRDSKFDLKSDEFREIHKRLEAKHGDLPTNIPEKRFDFNENIVNKFCIENLYKPLYLPVYPERTKKRNVLIDEITWNDIFFCEGEQTLDELTDIFEDLEVMRRKLKVGDWSNIALFKQFVKGCITKYGESKTKYYFEYLMKRHLCYE
jgi:hypothetical protein